jgi:hypothetical protein
VNADVAQFENHSLGKLLALAVNSAKRSPALPDVPTLTEAGVPDAEYPLWYGLFVPAKTPSSVVDKLNPLRMRSVGTNLRHSVSSRWDDTEGVRRAGQGRNQWGTRESRGDQGELSLGLQTDGHSRFQVTQRLRRMGSDRA